MLRSTLLVLILSCIIFSQDSSTPLEKSPFPLEASLISLKTHETEQLAVSISFYNDSPRLIKGFTGLVQFIVKGEIVSEVMLEITKDLPPEENTLWYGAIPYDASNPQEVLLTQESVDDIEVHVVVKAIVNANGVQKVY